MTNGQDLVERPADEEAHLKCLQKVFCEETRSPAKRLYLDGKKDKRSQKERQLKHQRDGDL